MSRAMEEKEKKHQPLPQPFERSFTRLMDWIENDLIPHLEDRQDCDQDQSGYHPNEEMRLLSDLEAILGRSGRPW